MAASAHVEYLQRADDCEKLAERLAGQIASYEQRAQFLQLAARWRELAAQASQDEASRKDTPDAA